MRRSLLGLLLTCSLAVGQSGLRPQYSAVAPGLDYAHITATNQPWSIHIARWDRSHKELGLATTLGKGTIQGLSSLSAQAKAIPARIGHPLAAVNGDFFLIKPGPYQGDPEGLQILNGELVSAPGPISFWTESGKVHIEKVGPAMEVTWPDGQKSAVGLNQTPRTNSAVLFTPIFGPSTRATNTVELVLEKAEGSAWLPLRASQTYRARVRSLNLFGDTPLDRDIAVLSLGAKLTNHLASLPAGAVLQLSTAMSRDLSRATTAIGGGPLLVHAGKAQTWPAVRGSTTAPPRHPRTGLGFNTRYFFLVEVDGRQKELSIGMTFVELAAFMKTLGCTEAMNLDGGGSSTFWLDGKVMNSPSDKHERSLANALFIVRRAPDR